MEGGVGSGMIAIIKRMVGRLFYRFSGGREALWSGRRDRGKLVLGTRKL